MGRSLSIRRVPTSFSNSLTAWNSYSGSVPPTFSNLARKSWPMISRLVLSISLKSSPIIASSCEDLLMPSFQTAVRKSVIDSAGNLVISSTLHVLKIQSGSPALLFVVPTEDVKYFVSACCFSLGPLASRYLSPPT